MNKTLIASGLLLALLVPSAFAGSQSPQATVLCVELQGNADTRYDVKARSGGKCARGERTVALPRGLRGPRWSARASRRTWPCRPAGTRRARRGQPELPAPRATRAIRADQGERCPRLSTALAAVDLTRVKTDHDLARDRQRSGRCSPAHTDEVGGSVFYSGLNGMRLGDIVNLVYTGSSRPTPTRARRRPVPAGVPRGRYARRDLLSEHAALTVDCGRRAPPVGRDRRNCPLRRRPGRRPRLAMGSDRG